MVGLGSLSDLCWLVGRLCMLCLQVYISSMQWRRAFVYGDKLHYWEDVLV